jgi:hypothetical protein
MSVEEGWEKTPHIQTVYPGRAKTIPADETAE